MKTKHRLLALLLSLCMILSLMPLGAMAAGGDVCKLTGSSNDADNKDYTSFAAALAKANASSAACTITLLADCALASVDNGTPISKNLTITSTTTPFKKLTLTPNGSGYQYLVVNSGVTLTLKDITMETSGKNDMFHNSGTINITGCNFIAGNPENGIFNITETGSVIMNSGTLTATGFITNGGNGLSLKTGDGTSGVVIIGGTIRLNKSAFITLLADSDATPNKFNIQTAADAAGGEKIVDGTVANTILADLAAKITINGGADWKAAVSGSDIVLERLPVRYVLADATGGDGTSAKPYATLKEAYGSLNDGGEIRVLSNLTADAATTFGDAKTVTVTSYTDAATPKAGDSWTVTRGDALKNQTACTVSAGSVTLKNIVFDGGAKWGNEGLLARTNSGIRNVDSAVGGDTSAGMLFTVSSGGTLTLDTGAVLQNNDRQHSEESGGDRGSAVYVNGGTLTMKTGASIKDNRVTGAGFGNIGDGAAVAIWGNTGTFTMNGGTITGNTVGRMGGAIRVADTGSTMKLYGGSITGNATKSAADCGGISVNDGTLYLKGTPVVKDNLQNAKECNIIYKNNIVIDVSHLAAGANIGVTGVAGDITTATAIQDDAAFVHSDNRQLKVEFDTNKLKLVADPNAYVSASGSDSGDGSKELPYKTIGTAYAQVATGGTIYVMTDLAPTETTDFATAGKAVTITSCKADGTPWASAADTHTIKRSVGSLFTINKGTVTLKNITLTDKNHHVNSPVCIGNATDAASPKLVMATGATITGTESNFAAVYIFKGELEMKTGSSIMGNTNKAALDSGTPVKGAGGGVCVYSGKLRVGGNVKITGNTANGTASNVYLADAVNMHFCLASDLTVDTRIGVSGIDAAMVTGYQFGHVDSGIKNQYFSNITQDAGGANPIATYKDSGELHWAEADKTWLDAVADAANGYGWNDDGSAGNTDGINGGGTPNNGSPNGIIIDTPAKLYSLAWAIQTDYQPLTGTAASAKHGADYANGYYYVNRDLDMTGFTWIPLGTTAIPFTGVFEGEGVRTISGINYSANALFGLFGTVNGTGKTHAITGTNSATSLNTRYTGTAIYNLAVDGSKNGKAWAAEGNSSHLGGIAAKATDATIQNCAVRNLSLSIVNYAGNVRVGGIVGETLGTTCKLLNNSVGQSGAAMTLLSDAGSGAHDAHTGGIVGKATSTTISGNAVGGNNAHMVTIVADPADTDAAKNYAGGVVGYMDGGSIANETWAHLNAMTVRATNNHAGASAYAGGVAGYLKDATMTNCTPGANSGEKHSVETRAWDSSNKGSNYAGGLVGGMAGTSVITNCTVGSDAPANYKVTSGAGVESFAGGLVGDATDARIYQCSAESIGVHGGNSGGLAGRFTATSLAGIGTKDAPGVMAMCYARNCSVTSAPTTGQYCGMMQTVTNAYILGCYATAATPGFNGFYAVANATNSNFVGCYSTVSTATAMTSEGNATFENCYVLNPNSSASAALDDAAIVGLTADKMTSGRNDTALIAALNDGLNDANKTNFDNMTGNLRMSYMSGNSPEINGNYNYPIYAVWMLTVNTAPGSVYGSYTVTADGKPISAPGATGLNQYWVGKGATVKVTGTPDGIYATAAATYKLDAVDAVNLDSITMDGDKIATVIFTPVNLPGWAINTDLSGVKSEPYNDVASGALTATANKLTGNTVKSWVKTAGGSDPWGANTRTIKTIFVTASTATDGASNPIISAFTADGWTVATGGMNKGYVQLTNAQGADAAAVSAIVNSIEFAAEKTATGDVTVNVQVYVDENVRGSMYYNSANGSIYELAGSPASYASAKLLAETSTFGAKKHHLVVIGDSAEHKFLRDNVKTNAWTAAVSTGDNTTLTNWKWDGVSATADETSYLQNPSSWQTGEPNNSGTYATYNYGGKLDDTNGANLALIEYETTTASAAGWQAYSALASGTVTCHVDVPVAPNPGPGPDPEPEPKPDPNRPVDPKITGVANSLETTDHRAYMVGNDQGQFLPDNGITRAEVSQIFYSLLKNKGNSADKASFPDVKAGSWYTPAINTMAALGILSGYPDGSFKPSQCISRAEFTAVAMRFAKMTTGKVAFSDVSKDYWAYDAISGAAAYRWIMGYADGTFRPLANITRAEAARVVNTMLDRAGDKSFIDKATGLKLFPDVAKANWAFYEIVEATNGHNYTRDKAGNELWK